MATTKKETIKKEVVQEDKEEVKQEKKSYLDYLIELEEQRFQYNTALRTLKIYRNVVLIDVFVFIACLITIWLIGANNFFTGWVGFVAVVSAIVFIVLCVYFFIDGWDGGERYGFYGWDRIVQLGELKKEIEQTEILIRILQSRMQRG